jgi:hypothetical protein
MLTWLIQAMVIFLLSEQLDWHSGCLGEFQDAFSWDNEIIPPFITLPDVIGDQTWVLIG